MKAQAAPKPAPSPLPATPEESHPGLALEADYAEATFAFTNRKNKEALGILNAILKKDPKYIQALELKALILKTLSDDKESILTYRAILPLKAEKERGPYYFELGVLHSRAKNYKDAEAYFNRSLNLKFNVGMSHFFLGSIHMQTKDLKRALQDYKSAIPDVPDEIKVACHYYLGSINAMLGYGPGATDELIIARDDAAKLEGNAMAAELGKAATLALAPYDKSNWYGVLSLVGQYDGNVSNISSSVAPEDATGKTSMRTNLNFSGGYISSPMRTLQLNASYRLAGNFNFNTEARDYEFATNTLSLVLTYGALARTNWGVRLEGAYGFQNRQDTDTGSYGFRPYNNTLEGAPFLKMEIYERAQLTLEAGYRTQAYSLDGTGINQRGGNVITPRASAKFDTDSNYFNPTGSVTYEMNNSQGTEYKSTTFSLDVANSLKLAGNHSLSLSATFSMSSYPQRSVSRSDTTISLRAGWQKPVSSRLTLTADAGYSTNSSTLPDLFSYSKPTVSAGFSYQL